MKKKFPVIVFFISVAVLAFSSPRNKEVGANDLNVLVITLDTTRADVLGLYGNKNNLTPNIDRIGQNGIVFKECHAEVPLTLPSHCTIFTGRYPIAHQVRNNGVYCLSKNELTMAEIFKTRGFQTSAIISSFTLNSEFGLSQGFDSYDEDFDSPEVILNFDVEIPADRVYDKFMRWIERNNNQKFFCWVHFYDPHFPYISHDDGSAGVKQSQWDNYESEVRYADTYIGKMADVLQSKKMIENTIVIIVGDHGEAFGEHGEYGHGIFCYEESLRVPLIVYHPRLFAKGRFVTERVGLADIMPTVLEINRFKRPKNIQGRSLLGLLQGKTEKKKRTFYFESMFGSEENNWTPLTGIIYDKYKYISLSERELYDLSIDPREANNLYEEKKDVFRKLDKKLEKIVRSTPTAQLSSKRKLSKSDIERLKSLGYISSFSNKTKQMMDPKKGIVVYSQIQEIRDIIKQKNYGLAETKLNELISVNPEIELPSLYEISYEIEKNKGNRDKALGILQHAVTVFPKNEALKMRLAIELFTGGELTKTLDICRQLIEEDNQFTPAYILRGDVYTRLNQIEEALRNYEQACALEPQNKMIKAKYVTLLLENNELQKALPIMNELEKHEKFIHTPAYLEMISTYGIRLISNGEGAEAIAIFKKVIDINPRNPEAWVNLGCAYFNSRQFDMALENYQEALKIDKNFALAKSNIGLVYLNKYAEDNQTVWLGKALESFNEAIILNPRLGAAYNSRALAFLCLDKKNEAVMDFIQAIEQEPDFMDSYFNIIIVLKQLGRYSEALTYLNLCKKRFSDKLSPHDREELERLESEIRLKKNLEVSDFMYRPLFSF